MDLKIALFCFSLSALWALPQTPMVREGDVQFLNGSSQALEMQTSDRAIIDWQDFSIELDELVTIHQPSATSALLNRVIEANPSRLLGSLKADGQVILINPHGLLVGRDAQINTGSFIASTLDLQNDCFLANKELKFVGDGFAVVENYGTIQTQMGPAALVGNQVIQNGSIEAKDGLAGLFSANEFIIRPDSSSPIYVRSKTYNSENPFEGAFHVSMEGTITAKDVYVLGDWIWLKDGSKIDSSGGQVLVGGDYRGQNSNLQNSSNVFFAKDAHITADSLAQGNGGKVILWSNGANVSLGSISSRGGSNGGDGGFVEVSGLASYMMRSPVDVTAPFGIGGHILLDPTDVTITGADLNDLPLPVCPAATYAFTANTATIDVGYLNGTLLATAGCTVTITTSNAFPAPPLGGTITVASAIGWATSANLILNADQDIIANANILSTSNGNTTLTAARNITVNGVLVQNTSIGNVTLNATGGGGSTILLTATPSFVAVGSAFGTTTVNAPGATLSLVGGGVAGQNATLGSIAAVSPSGPINVISGDINLLPNIQDNTFARIGHGNAIAGSTSNFSGDITVNSSGIITLFCPFNPGNSPEGASATIGHGDIVNSDNTGMSTTGNISVAGAALNMTGGGDIVNPNNLQMNWARIGHGSWRQPTVGGFITGNIDVNITGDINMAGGLGTGCGCRIGHGPGETNFGGYGAITGNISTCCNNLTMITDNFLFGVFGAGSRDSAIGHGVFENDSNGPSAVAAMIGSIDVVCRGNLTMTHFGFTPNGPVPGIQVYIGHYVTGNFAFASAYDQLNAHYRVRVGGDATLNCLNWAFGTFIGLNGEGSNPFHIDGSVEVIVGGNLTLFSRTVVGLLGPFAPVTIVQPAGSTIGYVNIDPSFITIPSFPNTYVAAGGNITLNNAGLRGNTIGGLGDVSVSSGSDINMIFSGFNTEGNFIGSVNASPPSIRLTSVFAAGSIICTNSNPFNPNAGSFIGRERLYFPQAFDTPVIIRAGKDIQLSNNITLDPAAIQGVVIQASSAFGPGELWANNGSSLVSIANQPLTVAIPNSLPFPCGTIPPFFTVSSPFLASNCTGSFNIDTGLASGPILISSPNAPITILGGEFQGGGAPQNLTIGFNANNLLLDTNTGNITIGGPSPCCSFHDITVDANVPVSGLGTTGSILMIANDSMFLTANAHITSTASTVTLVVDNAGPFCTRPFIGPGAFIMDAAATIDSGLGQPLRIYTALRGQNSILGLLNGCSFIPGPLYVNSATEQWCTYFPEFTPGFTSLPCLTFTISYKDCPQIVLQQATKVVDEFLVDLHPFNEFPGWMSRFFVYYSPQLSDTLIPDEPYLIRRRNLNLINHPKTYTVSLNDELDHPRP